MNEADRKAKIADFEQKAKDYRTAHHLTEDFFCEYDPTKDYVLSFATAENNEVMPSCVDVLGQQNGIASKEQWVAQRLQTMERLTEVISRVEKFKKILDKYDNLTAAQQAVLDQYLEEGDGDILKHLEEMTVVVREIHTDLTKCSQTLYSEHDNALLGLKPNICEPLSDILTSIEKVIYPRMISVERTFSMAESRKNYNRLQSTFQALVDAAVSALKFIFGKLKSALVTVSNYIFLHSKTAMQAFSRFAGDGLRELKAVLCDTATPTKLWEFYVFLETLVQKAIEKSSPIRAAVRNKLRSFCQKDERKLIGFLETTVDDAKGELTETEQNKDVAKATAFSNYKSAMERLKGVVGTGFCKSVELMSDDKLSDNRVVALLWMICVTSMETFLKYFVSLNGKLISEICLDRAGFVVETKTLVVQGTKFVDEKNHASQMSVEQNNQVIQDMDIKVAMENIPRIANQMTTVIQNNKALWKAWAKISEGTADAAGRIIQVLFDFFWYFAEHNYLPTKEIENDVAKTYGPPAIDKGDDTYDNWMTKTWGTFKNPSVTRQIPEHVRYAFCRAQNNSADACLDLVTLDQPLTGIAEPEERYEKYIQNEKTKHKVEEHQEDEALLQDPKDVEDALDNILEEVGEKEPQNEQLKYMQRIASQRITQATVEQKQPVRRVSATPAVVPTTIGSKTLNTPATKTLTKTPVSEASMKPAPAVKPVSQASMKPAPAVKPVSQASMKPAPAVNPVSKTSIKPKKLVSETTLTKKLAPVGKPPPK